MQRSFTTVDTVSGFQIHAIEEVTYNKSSSTTRTSRARRTKNTTGTRQTRSTSNTRKTLSNRGGKRDCELIVFSVTLTELVFLRANTCDCSCTYSCTFSPWETISTGVALLKKITILVNSESKVPTSDNR